MCGTDIRTEWYAEECSCVCHETPGMVHFIPCCSKCFKCGRNITLGMMPLHHEKCTGGFNEEVDGGKEQDIPGESRLHRDDRPQEESGT